jgi:single-strand DNA-binding protein
MNKFIFTGRLGQDAESRQLQNTTAASYSVAITEKFTKNGEKVEKTTWVKCTSFGKGAEFAANYLKKGMKVMVEGKLEIQKWSDANGVARESIAVIAENIEILESNKPNDGQENGNWNQPAPAAAKAEPVASEGDDLPF